MHISLKYLISFCIVFSSHIALVNACQICVPFPTKTIADRILEANTIVLARESAERPYTFEAYTALKGELPAAGAINLLLNSQMRRILKADQELSAVLVCTGEGESQKWESIGTTKPEIEALVYEILKNAQTWEKDPKKRFDFFAQRLRHENRTIRELAYLEIGRAPYSEIRKLYAIVPRNEIHAFLQNFQYIEWHALYILLIALSEDPRDTEFIRDAFLNAARFGTYIRLAAWTTAYLEIEPDEALTAISDAYFSDPDRSQKELHAVVQAISVHGQSGHVHMRDRFVQEYETLLENHPEMAPMVVKDLFLWKRWELADQIRHILQNPTAPQYSVSTMMLRKYLLAANKATDKTN